MSTPGATKHAPEGVERVISGYRTGSNINPQLRRIIERAGIEPRPRSFHNLRASRQTELARDYPLHTVCAWIGNTKAIAEGHYLQVTDADWQRATGVTKCGEHLAQNTPQHPADPARTDSREVLQIFDGSGVVRVGTTGSDPAPTGEMGRGGPEDMHNSPGNHTELETGVTDSGAPERAFEGAALDPDLARVVGAWAKLPEVIKAAVLALLGAVER